MKINEIIIENDQYAIRSLASTDQYNSKDKILSLLKNECSDMITACQNSNTLIYRGIGGGSKHLAIINNIRPDRQPVEMDTESHYLLHDAFLELGLIATRTNSIFCTTDRLIASDWGKPYVIFIKDGWCGTVFKAIPWGYAYNVLSDLGNEAQQGDLEEQVPYLEQEIKKLNPIKVTTSNIVAVLNTNYDDMIFTGQSYIGLLYGSSLCNNILHNLQINANNA
jgi:hypothetical protein